MTFQEGRFNLSVAQAVASISIKPSCSIPACSIPSACPPAPAHNSSVANPLILRGGLTRCARALVSQGLSAPGAACSGNSLLLCIDRLIILDAPPEVSD